MLLRFSVHILISLLQSIMEKALALSNNSDLQKEFEIGSTIHGFEVIEQKIVPELQLTAFRLNHIKTGADYLHIAREDSNNVFCIGFKTTPKDSTGVAHILEHNVLCGSEKYPCRDPFFKMLNRSLSTFMNAMTGNDYTVYPFSTQNKVDFRNLMSVYLDAVFRPNLREIDFMQEGWRLEHKDVLDENSPIIFKGVVFNEMKGVFADSQQLFMQKLQNGVLPSHTYGVVSGGDPLHIPQLTWKDLKAFHADHYHPSNSRIYSYGDLSLKDHLDFIDSEYLSKFEKINPNTSVPEEPKWKEPRSSYISCSADPMAPEDRQTSLAVSYVLTSITDDFENFVLAILDQLLVRGPNAPFYKSLIETYLGTSFSPVSGFDNQTRTTTFTVGLQGMHKYDVNKVLSIIDTTFDSVMENGFASDRIESILHNIELSMKHQTSNFGLGLVLNLTPFWNHDGNLLKALEINSKIEKLRNILKENPQFLQEKVYQYFKTNTHKYSLVMSPERHYEQKLIQAEESLLEMKVRNLSEEDTKSVWEMGQLLKTKQETKEDLSCLPTLCVSDIPKTIPNTDIGNGIINGNIPLQLCIQPTNGVSYFNAVLSTKNLPAELAKFVPLLCNILTSMGAGNLDFRDLSQKIELVSGGFCSSMHIINHPEDSSLYEEGIHINSYCLQKNFVAMLDLWLNIMNELKLDDVSRFTTLINMIATEKSNSLIHNGHKYAISAASSSISYVCRKKEEVGGLAYLQNLKELCNSPFLSEILEKLKEVSHHLLNKNNIRVAINTSKETADADVCNVEKFIQNIQGEPSNVSSMSVVPSTFTPRTERTHHIFNLPVNYSAKAFSNIPYAHPDSGPLRILARLMFQFLHREIREKGGAYGGGAYAHPGNPFSFYSYRDPNSTLTLKTFDDAVDWVLTGEFTQQDINEAKLGVFQNVDAPVSPGERGMRQFLNHISDDMFSQQRLAILNATSDNLISVCRKYLKEASLQGTCLIGPQNSHIDKDPEWNKKIH
ncbi:Presequence protease, mitochondrial [Armadillidium vulgare]|nr:Presequence protease, mitochondrial [Armadillidium vulgare]